LRVTDEDGASLRRALGGWYARHRRDLPWRRTRDPYAIWVSETMLQQTRVQAVVEPYARFLERFPDVRALAAAGEDEVLAVWSGLGYYRRARALRRAAAVVVERFGGRFPDSREVLLELPGVGPYTAGAVASIAFDEPAPIVDGNVARVFARLFAIEEPVDLPATRRLLWSLAESLLPPRPVAAGEPRPGEWTQALMELGALVCTPRTPDCPACPVADACRSRATGKPDRLPRRTAKRATLAVALEALLIEEGGRVLLVRRPPTGRMAGMWELPTRERSAVAPPVLWPGSFPDPAGERLGAVGAPLLEIPHAITHHRIDLSLRRGRVRPARALLRTDAPSDLDDPWCFADPLASDLALTGMTRKVLSRLSSRAPGEPGESEPGR